VNQARLSQASCYVQAARSLPTVSSMNSHLGLHAACQAATLKQAASTVIWLANYATEKIYAQRRRNIATKAGYADLLFDIKQQCA